MSELTPRLPARPSLEQLQKQAKELLRQYRDRDPAAIQRFQAHPSNAEPTLAGAQFILAREHGFETWARLKHHIEALQPLATAGQLQQLALDLHRASHADGPALQRLNETVGTAFTVEGLQNEARERLAALKPDAPPNNATGVTLPDAQLLIAKLYGFPNWDALQESAAQPAADPRTAPHGVATTPPFYRIDWDTHTLHLGPLLSAHDWDTLIAVMQDHNLTGLEAGNRMTDAALARVASALPQLTNLNLDGSLQLTDAGLAHLANLTQLQRLNLGGGKGQITDQGLQVLRHLPQLKSLQLSWQQHITDAGIAHLAACPHLESVNLMGTPTGDGALQALAGKPNLHTVYTGTALTDGGLALLHHIPRFKAWQDGQPSYDLITFEAGPTYLLIDGPFTDAGLASLAGLDGLFGLNFFWHSAAHTPAGLAALRHLANLGYLAYGGERCTDEAMRHIAELPYLRMLQGQGTVATDAGFAALSRSQTLEYVWGRECPNLTGQGFAALSSAPSLRGLAVSWKNVDAAAIASLPHFPALHSLMPMDATDDAFRHIGQCHRLERLWCMYCRDTTDAATEHLTGLANLRTYYAGKTKITDRSLEILSRLTALERLEFWQCAGITNVGIAHLATLPNLRHLTLDNLTGVTRDALTALPTRVHVNYSS